jgi:hypothetical protein
MNRWRSHSLLFYGISVVGLLWVGWYYLFSTDDLEADPPALQSEAKGKPDTDGPGFSLKSKHGEERQNLSPEQVADRLEKIEKRLAQLADTISDVANLISQRGHQTTSGEMVSPPISQPMQRGADFDLKKRHAGEGGASAWGTQSAAAIEEAYASAAGERTFFTENSGKLSTDCRESVCSLTWTPEAAPSGDEERADLLTMAKWELLSLAGNAEEGGEITVNVNPATTPPTVELLIEHTSGGDRTMPEKVARYLGVGQ